MKAGRLLLFNVLKCLRERSSQRGLPEAMIVVKCVKLRISCALHFRTQFVGAVPSGEGQVRIDPITVNRRRRGGGIGQQTVLRGSMTQPDADRRNVEVHIAILVDMGTGMTGRAVKAMSISLRIAAALGDRGIDLPTHGALRAAVVVVIAFHTGIRIRTRRGCR